MRIRKRFLPSSLSSSLPLSDPQLSRSLVVQQHLHHGNNLLLQEELKTNPNRSDPHDNQPFQHPATGQEMVIGTENPILMVYPRNSSNSTTTQEQVKKQKEIEGKEIKDERWKTEEKKKISNDIRKENISSAQVLDMQFPQSSSSSCQAIDRWGEGERIVPPKKRKGSFERMGSKEMIKPKMKSKTNKKCLQQNGHHDVELEDHEKKVSHKEGGGDHDTTKNSTSSSTKKSKRGNVIMEGSRCSRVNGRGWRCCQQTLVGYSLCEHHLGKGRLRSMTSVRNRAMADQNSNNITTAAAHDQDYQIKNINETAAAAARLTQKQDQIVTKFSSTNNIVNHVVAPPDQELDERKPLLISRKKRMMKIGAVKARSISSLLGQTDSAGAGAGAGAGVGVGAGAGAANRNKISSTS